MHFPFTQMKQQYIARYALINGWFLTLRNMFKLVQGNVGDGNKTNLMWNYSQTSPSSCIAIKRCVKITTQNVPHILVAICQNIIMLDIIRLVVECTVLVHI